MNYLPGKIQWLLALLTSIAWGTGVPAAVADDQVSDGIRDKRRAIIAEKVAAAEKVEQLVLPGSDGWLRNRYAGLLQPNDSHHCQYQ